MKLLIITFLFLLSLNAFADKVEVVKGIQITKIEVQANTAFGSDGLEIEEFKILKTNTRSCFRQVSKNQGRFQTSIDCAFFDHVKNYKP